MSGDGKYVTANGIDIYFETAGMGHPLILLHGGAQTSNDWRSHIPLFAEHFKVYAPDSRGHGRTHNPAGELSYALMADDVASFIKALDLKEPLVFGYSDGGQITLELGIRHPDLARAIVLGATLYKNSDAYINWLREMGILGPGQVDFDHIERIFPEAVVSALRAAHAKSDDPDYWKSLFRQLSVVWLNLVAYTPDDFQKIVNPTLVIVGDRDEGIPVEQGVDMYRFIPEAELAILPRASHGNAIAEESFGLQIILDFLLRHCSENEASLADSKREAS